MGARGRRCLLDFEIHQVGAEFVGGDGGKHLEDAVEAGLQASSRVAIHPAGGGVDALEDLVPLGEVEGVVGHQDVPDGGIGQDEEGGRLDGQAVGAVS